jgi:predicted double-glycine peptidase
MMNVKDIAADIIKQTSLNKAIIIDGKVVKAKLTDFPSLRQVYSYSCGASALQVLTMFYGYDMREGQIIEKIGTTEEGTERENMIKFLKKLGFKVEERQKYTIDNLKNFINKNMPVIIPLQAWVGDDFKPGWEKGWDNGHYVVVMGYTDDHIIFSDPSSIYDTYLSYEELDLRWHDVGMTPKDKLDHYAIVPYGKKQEFHSDVFIHMD